MKTKTAATETYYQMTDARTHRWVSLDELAARVGVTAEDVAAAFTSDPDVEFRSHIYPKSSCSQVEFLMRG